MDGTLEWDAASSAYHSRHEIFSSRRPSCSDSLHFVNSAQSPESASFPSRSFRTSGASAKTGVGKDASIAYDSSTPTDRPTSREKKNREKKSNERQRWVIKQRLGRSRVRAIEHETRNTSRELEVAGRRQSRATTIVRWRPRLLGVFDGGDDGGGCCDGVWPGLEA